MFQNIILVGPMGAGKSTIGKLLAAKLNLAFIDTDTVIEDRSGADIPWIFDVEGEEGFRARETAVISDLKADSGLVIATGGGIVLRDENRKLLKQLGTVLYITADIDQLFERTSKDKKRPLLQVEDPKSRIRELLEQREGLYESAADHKIVTDSRGTKLVVQTICQLLDLQ